MDDPDGEWGDLDEMGLDPPPLIEPPAPPLYAPPLYAPPPPAMTRADPAGRSALTVEEFAAIHSVGFDPVAPVQGGCVYQIGWYGNADCVGNRRISGDDASYWRGLPGPRAMRDEDYSIAGPHEAALRAARTQALDRLTSQAAAVGGDGVVGVRLTAAPFLGAPSTWQFQATGTAVRSRVRPVAAPTDPFRSALSGQDFARLLRAGWTPVDITMGVASVVRHIDVATRQDMQRFTGSREIAGLTTLTQAARTRARDLLFSDVRARRGAGCVIGETRISVSERECRMFEHQKDFLATALLIGTAITHFRDPAPGADPRPLPILPLGREGRLDLHDSTRLYTETR